MLDTYARGIHLAWDYWLSPDVQIRSPNYSAKLSCYVFGTFLGIACICLCTLITLQKEVYFNIFFFVISYRNIDNDSKGCVPAYTAVQSETQ